MLCFVDDSSHRDLHNKNQCHVVCFFYSLIVSDVAVNDTSVMQTDHTFNIRPFHKD